jgi:hypothetical protein
MTGFRKTILTDADGLAACSVTTECALPGAFTLGEVTASPVPIPAIEGAAHLALEIAWLGFWPARHNHEIWQTGPDGICAWRNQADGVFE